jgi:large conductance mechanosensitive channel
MKERTKQLEGNRVTQIAGGVVLGLAVWNVVESFVRFLLAPLISVYIGNSRFQLNSFKIDTSEFEYGYFLESLFVVVAVVLILMVVFPALWGQILGRSSRSPSRCPECQEPVASEARRCPHCTVVLAGDAS